MKEIILLKNGEIALKGLNRGTFEDRLIKNAKNALRPLGEFKFYKAQSTIYCEPREESQNLDAAVRRLKQVFGFVGISRACVAPKDFAEIARLAPAYLEESLSSAHTFKVNAKRSDKRFPMGSPEICAELGGLLLEKFPNLSVDVHNPDIIINVEIRDFAAYIHAGQEPGAGGIPVGSGGNASLLISGGIDSPVAGYMMAKRGLELSAIHFVSPPYTSELALQKVVTLLEKVSLYTGAVRLSVVEFTNTQLAIRDKCPEDFFTIIMRRTMMRVAEKLAAESRALALVTGESLGQVASQTLHALRVTEAVCEMPVLRPLIGMDKSEIIKIAREINTFETSILPYEDCCTVFTPRHPKTKPTLAETERHEAALDLEALVAEALAKTTVSWVQG